MQKKKYNKMSLNKLICKKRLFHIIKIFERIFAIAFVLLILYHCCFDLSVIVTQSMSPTLCGESKQDGDWVLIEKITYLFRNPGRWELVSFNKPEGIQVIKRVVALPEETLSINKFEISINNKSIEMPEKLNFLKYYSFGMLNKGALVKCENSFFVMGDYSRDSEDSRFHGPIEAKFITGRPFLRIWPLSRFGFVNP
jgi:signal peptidase I